MISRLIGINAVSLVIALVANFALLLNMTQRLSFKIAQPITIIGWYISGFILVALMVAAVKAPSFQLESTLNGTQEVHLTQAFYYAIMSAALYFIIASLMTITVYGAYAGHYPKKFELTMSQRTLMVQTIAFLFYLLAGAAVFSKIENWLFLNGVYWASTTLLTVGTGDFSPKTHLGQGLLFPYAIGGIVILGLVVGSIRSLVLERGKKKLSARITEKKREQIVKQWQKHENNIKVSHFSKAHDLSAEDKTELERREQEFDVMRQIQEHSHTRRKWLALTISLSCWMVLWFIGAVVFWRAERLQQGLTYFEALYFSYVSLLTIGYGDYAPVANASKAFFVFWSLLAVPTLTILISNMGDTVVKLVRDVSLWAAEFTLLPGERSMRQRLTKPFREGKLQKIFSNDQKPVEESPGGAFMPEQDKDVEGNHDEHKPKQINRAVDALGEEAEERQLSEVEKAKRSGSKLDEDLHLYHYLLVHQIREVMKDSGESPPKQYRYHEWRWFLRLLGETEDDKQFHRKPPVEATEEDLDGGIGNAGQKWSWLGARSPLLGEMNEADWLLSMLTEKLEQLLLTESKRYRESTSDSDKASKDFSSDTLSDGGGGGQS